MKKLNKKKGINQIQILARKDMNGPYDPTNCFWRNPHNEQEARTGIEQLSQLEPDELTYTKEEEKINTMTSNQKRQYKIWKRMIWRAEYYPLNNN